MRHTFSVSELFELVVSVSVLLLSRSTLLTFPFFFLAFLHSFSGWPIFPQISHSCFIALQDFPCSLAHPASPHLKQCFSSLSTFLAFFYLLPTGSSFIFTSEGCFRTLSNSRSDSTAAYMNFSLLSLLSLFSHSCLTNSVFLTVLR